MKNRKISLSTILAFSSAAFFATSTTEASASYLEEQAHPDFEFRSLVKISGTYVFSIYHRPSGGAAWASPGENVKGLAVREYDDSIRALRVEIDEQSYLLWLQSSAASPSSSTDPAAVGNPAPPPHSTQSPAADLRIQVAPRGLSKQMVNRPQDGDQNAGPDQIPEMSHASTLLREADDSANEPSSPSFIDISRHETVTRSHHVRYRVAPRTAVNRDVF